MSRLQQIKRANGSVVHSINLPLEIMEQTRWEKGDELLIEYLQNGNRIIITKEV